MRKRGQDLLFFLILVYINNMKKIIIAILSMFMLAACSGESSSSSRFVPPSETSSSDSSGDSSGTSASYSGMDIDEAKEKADAIIAAQEYLTSYYQDYKMTNSYKEDSIEGSSTYIYSPLHSFYSVKQENGNGTYLVTIDGTETLIVKDDEGTKSYTNETVIALSSGIFATISLRKDLSLTLLERAFSEETTIALNEAYIDTVSGLFTLSLNANDSFPFPNNITLSYNDNGTPATMSMTVTEGSFEGDYLSYSFSYGTTLEDRQYPSI